MKKLMLLLAFAAMIPALHAEKKEDKVVIVSTPEQQRVLWAMWATAIASIWLNRHEYTVATPAQLTQPLVVQPMVVQ